MMFSSTYYCISCCVSGAVLQVSRVFVATLAAQGCRQCHPTLRIAAQPLSQSSRLLTLEFGSSFRVCGVPL